MNKEKALTNNEEMPKIKVGQKFKRIRIFEDGSRTYIYYTVIQVIRAVIVVEKDNSSDKPVTRIPKFCSLMNTYKINTEALNEPAYLE